MNNLIKVDVAVEDDIIPNAQKFHEAFVQLKDGQTLNDLINDHSRFIQIVTYTDEICNVVMLNKNYIVLIQEN